MKQSWRTVNTEARVLDRMDWAPNATANSGMRDLERLRFCDYTSEGFRTPFTFKIGTLFYPTG